MKHRVGVSALFVCLVLVLLCVCHVSALTYSENVDVQFTFLPSIQISFSTNDGFVINNLVPGTSAYSNTVTITASSNNVDGFVLSATVGKINDNNRNNNKLVHTNNSDSFEGVATNASLTLDNLGSNKWGYALYDATNEIWSNYSGLAAVGNTGTTIASTNTADAISVDMRIGANSSSNQVSGTFTNDINFSATANIVTYSYSLSFAANNTDTVIDMPTNIANGSFDTGDAIKISSTTPSTENGIFLGWCDDTVSGTNCNGTLYQPGDYIKIDSISTLSVNSVSLTAVWKPRMTNMQNMTMADCMVNVGLNGNSSNIGDTIIVYDLRSDNYASDDDGDYTVRYIDGVCWMTQNLRVTGTLSAVDSNFSTNSTWNVSAGDLENGTSATVAYSHLADSSNVSDLTSLTATNIDGSPITIKSLGAYYNYCAASAGVACSANMNDADEDICPAGWRLPSRNDFRTMTEDDNSVTQGGTNNASLFMPSYSSGYGAGAWAGSFTKGKYGYWWISEVMSANNAYYGMLTASSTMTINNVARGMGYSIRCVLANS